MYYLTINADVISGWRPWLVECIHVARLYTTRGAGHIRTSELLAWQLTKPRALGEP